MPDDFNPTEWITTTEAAQLTGYNVRYLRQLVNQGKIRSVKRGGIFWIDRDSARAYADKMKQLGSAKHDPWRAGARQKSNRTE
jgi:excisionase family DNA binding protein